MTLLLVPTLEVDVANITIRLVDFYQGLLECNLLCGCNEVLGSATIPLLGRINMLLLAVKKVGCIEVAWIELQEPAAVMMVGSHIPPPSLEPAPPQITSTTF